MNLIVIFAIVGLMAALYSVKTHYEGGEHSICSFNETFNCDIVNQSIYSEFLGIPVALIGVGGYVFFLASILQYKNSKNEMLMNFMGMSALVGSAFSLYLTYVEAYVLYTWCIVCLTSAFSMIAVTVAVLWLRQIDLKPQEFKHE